MKKLIFLLLILSFSISLSTFDILQEALEKDGKIPLRGTEVSIFYNENGIPMISISRVIYGGNYKLRREYLAPPFFLGKTIIDDGTKRYEYTPNFRRLIISPTGFINNLQEIRKRVELIKKNYKVVNIGSENIADRKAVVVLLVSKYTNLPVLRLWIDMETYFLLRKDRYNSDGKLISRTFFTEIKYSESRYPESLFKPDPLWKPNVVIDEPILKEINIKDDKEISLELPFGYVLEKLFLIPQADNIILYYYRYTDGLNTLSLFKSNIPFIKFKEPRSLGPFKGIFEESILWKSFMWRDEKWTYFLIADIPYNKIETFLKKIFP
ncbi:MAG: sigma-E factor regulatory protein RseB domain-containing protein [Dictyoglomaceae bacterium]